MTGQLYTCKGLKLGYQVHHNGFSFMIDGRALSVDEIRAKLTERGANAETVDVIVNDLYQAVREDALRKGWKHTAQLTIRTE